MLLMIDNYDSFTYNIVQYLSELGAEVKVIKNDEYSVDELDQFKPTHLVISPGPCTPNEAGISIDAIKHFAGTIPILGVCLGHQCIGQLYGGKVIRAKEVVHGKVWDIYHKDTGVFQGLTQPFKGTRYHSLVLEHTSLPNELEITSWTQDESGDLDEIMGIRHKDLDIEGVQYHPESIMSQHGHDLLANFLKK